MSCRIVDNDELNETLLIHETAHSMRKLFDRRAQHLGLTRSQWRVFCILRRSPGMHQSQIADNMEIEPITLVRLLDRMERAGWITRRADPNDRRANQIYLTEKAKPIISKMQSLALELRRDALEGFSEQEHNKLLQYLARMKSNLSSLLGDGVAPAEQARIRKGKA